MWKGGRDRLNAGDNVTGHAQESNSFELFTGDFPRAITGFCWEMGVTVNCGEPNNPRIKGSQTQTPMRQPQFLHPGHFGASRPFTSLHANLIARAVDLSTLLSQLPLTIQLLCVRVSTRPICLSEITAPTARPSNRDGDYGGSQRSVLPGLFKEKASGY